MRQVLSFLEKGRRIGVEIKRSDAPRWVRSMQIVSEDLNLDELRVLYPGTRKYALAEDLHAVPLDGVIQPSRD